jgi:hypothetical protein
MLLLPATEPCLAPSDGVENRRRVGFGVIDVSAACSSRREDDTWVACSSSLLLTGPEYAYGSNGTIKRDPGCANVCLPGTAASALARYPSRSSSGIGSGIAPAV